MPLLWTARRTRSAALLGVVVSLAAVALWSVLLFARRSVVEPAAKIIHSAPGPELSDSFGDGTPDLLRLTTEADRRAFRTWFTFIAESRFFTAANNPQVQDCAGLLRLAYRSALQAHDANWAAGLNLTSAPDSPPVQQYRAPFTPAGATLFRVRAGQFQAGDLRDGTFAEFADANTLRRYNTYLVGRDMRRAKPGDLLFYRQHGQTSPYHAMIFLGRSQFSPEADLYVVYHTGPVAGRPGEIRRPTLRELYAHPDARWHPVPENRAFLGVYRWNILRGAD